MTKLVFLSLFTACALNAAHLRFPRWRSFRRARRIPQALLYARGKRVGRPSLQVTTSPLWHEIANPLPESSLAIAVCCKVTIFSRQPKLLKKLTLVFQPSDEQCLPRIPHIEHASLYQHRHRQNFVPDNEAYLTSGTWSPSENTLAFDLHDHNKVVAKKTFYIVVSCRPNEIDALRAGSFVFTDRHPLVTHDLRKKQSLQTNGNLE